MGPTIGWPPKLRDFVRAYHPAARVRIPSTPSMIFQFVLKLQQEKNENKLKKAGIGPFLKTMGPT